MSATIWAACDATGNCRQVNWDPNAGNVAATITISASVGSGGVNKSGDVKTIQEALNKISTSDGGASPPLNVDGFFGPLTGKAIRHFQQVQFPGWTPDGRVDPNQKTIRRMNELGSSSKQAFTDPAAKSIKGGDVTDPSQIDQAVSLAADALARVRRAKNRLAVARATFALPDSLFASDHEKRLAAWHFKVHRAADPLGQIDRVRRVYEKMEETLFMALRPGTPFRLFQAGKHPDPQAIAYAHWGGYEFLLGEKEEGELGKYIYITPKFRTASSSVIIHELGHYCGGRRHSHHEISHIASPSPWPNGEPRDDSKRGHNYAQLTADEAFCNTYSYQVYAFPEFPEHRIPDSFKM